MPLPPPETLGDCNGRNLNLSIMCAGCGTIRQISHGLPLMDWCRRYGAATPLPALKRRLRCARCGGRAQSLEAYDLYAPKGEGQRWRF